MNDKLHSLLHTVVDCSMWTRFVSGVTMALGGGTLLEWVPVVWGVLGVSVGMVASIYLARSHRANARVKDLEAEKLEIELAGLRDREEERLRRAAASPCRRAEDVN